MAAPRDRKHVFVSARPRVDSYTPYRPNFPHKDLTPSIGRSAHGRDLKAALQQAEVDGLARRSAVPLSVHGASPGLYVQFESAPGLPLAIASLEDGPKGIEVVAVAETRSADVSSKPVQWATVFVPDGQVRHFVER